MWPFNSAKPATKEELDRAVMKEEVKELPKVNFTAAEAKAEAIRICEEIKRKRMAVQPPSEDFFRWMKYSISRGEMSMQRYFDNEDMLTPGNVLWLEENGYEVEIEPSVDSDGYTRMTIYWGDPEDGISE